MSVIERPAVFSDLVTRLTSLARLFVSRAVVGITNRTHHHPPSPQSGGDLFLRVKFPKNQGVRALGL